MKHPGVQKLIDHLEHLDNSPQSECGFDMNYQADNREHSNHCCGSACCIGGHAALLLEDENLSPETALSRLCEIPEEDADRLCWPGSGESHVEYKWVSLHDALGVLRNYRDTGEVDWQEVADQHWERRQFWDPSWADEE